jgi:hypothetical protein
MNYPLIYRADTALFYTSTAFDTLVNKRIVITQDSAIATFVNQPVKTTEKIQVLRFFPNQFDFEIYSQQPGFYCLFQNYYPRWRLYIDGAKAEIFTSNVSFMSFHLRAGQHLVSFRYKGNDLVITFYINILLSLSIIIFGILQLFQFYSSPDAMHSQNKN